MAKASIIGNVLLVLGASLLFGGLIGIQSFSATIAGVNASMLAIVATALALPTIFVATEAARDGGSHTILELGALGASVTLTSFTALDGKSNWLEGTMLCGVTRSPRSPSFSRRESETAQGGSDMNEHRLA